MISKAWRHRLLRLLARDPAEHALAREVVGLAWPAVLQGLVGTVMLFTDRLVLGRYADDALGSMQVSGAVLWSAFNLMGAFGVGTLAVAGRQCGAGDWAAARATARGVLRLAVVLGVVLAGIGMWLREPAGLWLAPEASPAVRAQASSYMGVVFLAAPFELLAVAGAALLQGAGDTRTAMRAAWLAAALNLGLTSGLTFGLWGLPELGVVGAAIGTSAAFAVQGLWVALGARRLFAARQDARRVPTAPPASAMASVPALPINESARLPSLPNAELAALSVGPAGVPAELAEGPDSKADSPGASEAGPPAAGLAEARQSSLPALGAVLRVSGPTLVERIIYHGGYLVFSSFIGRLGDAAMTAHQALLAIESLGFIAADGFGIAAGAIVARKLGARDPQGAERGARLAQRLGFGVLCGVGLFFLLAADVLVGLFTDDPTVQVLGARCLRVAVVAQPLMALVDALAYALRGAGETRTPLRAALVGPVLVRLSACWFFTFQLDLGLLGIWLGTNFDWGVRAVWLERAFARGAWKTVKV